MNSVSSTNIPESFSLAFERLQASIDPDDARSFASTTLKDLWSTARSIEFNLEKSGSLRGFRRIQPFLSGIEQYAKVIEVCCNGTPFMPYAWVSRLRENSLVISLSKILRRQSNSFSRLVLYDDGTVNSQDYAIKLRSILHPVMDLCSTIVFIHQCATSIALYAVMKYMIERC